MKCPNCTGILIKKKNTSEGVTNCSKCGSNWFIIQYSKRSKVMWNKILDFIKNWQEKQKERPITTDIEKRIKNSKDHKNRYGG